MRTICVCLMFLVGFVGFENEAFAACVNKVGGVCVDKQPSKPAKKPVRKKTKKKTVKKKTPRKEVVVPVEKPVVEVKTADSCVQVKRGKPKRAGGVSGASALKVSNVTVKNHCTENIRVYVTLSPCRDPKGHFWSAKQKSQKIFKIRAKGRTTFQMGHTEAIRNSDVLVMTNAYYSTQGGGSYPRFAC